MGHFLPKSDVRVMSDHLPIADMRRSAVNRRNGPNGDIIRSRRRRLTNKVSGNQSRLSLWTFSS